MIRLSFRTELTAPASEVWATVSTMAGVNAELRPLMRMTHPAHLQTFADVAGDPVPGEVVFHGWRGASAPRPLAPDGSAGACSAHDDRVDPVDAAGLGGDVRARAGQSAKVVW